MGRVRESKMATIDIVSPLSKKLIHEKESLNINTAQLNNRLGKPCSRVVLQRLMSTPNGRYSKRLIENVSNALDKWHLEDKADDTVSEHEKLRKKLIADLSVGEFEDLMKKILSDNK